MTDRTQSGAAQQGDWARPVPARLGEVMMGLALFAAALFFIWHAAFLPLGRVGLPGPGFFPLALGVALGLLALAILYRVPQSTHGAEAIFFGHRDVLIVIGALIGVAFAFERADTYLLLGTFAALLLHFVARAALWRAALGAALGMVAVWALFALALGVRLPTGEFWQQILAPIL
jgi:hypothetical protein